MAAIACLCSCEETILDGAWDPMELDKTHVNFPSEGGQNTVSVLNYTRWWINGGYDFAELVDSQWEYRGYVHAKLNEEAIKVIESSSNGWVPAIKDGKKIPITMMVPVIFKK